MTALDAAFLAASALAVASALIAVTRESPIYTALFTAIAMGGVALDMLLLHAPFLATMQVLLYGGAIMVLFVFVIMLLSLKKEELGHEPGGASRSFAGAVALGVFLLLAYPAWVSPGRVGMNQPPKPMPEAGYTTAEELGSTEHFGKTLYGEALVPFELVSVLLLAALAGVVLLARKRLTAPPEPPKAAVRHEGARAPALVHSPEVPS